MSFNAIAGHDETLAFLSRAVESGKVAHAYIFLGPSGIGKTLVALNFAKALNCLGTAGERPCDSCAACKKIDASLHPDVRLVRLPEGSSSIGIDDIREVIKDVSLKAYEGSRKTYIIDGAEALTHQAQGALLKTFEEPSSDAVIILITDRLEALLPTIVSRAEVIKFFPLRKDDVKDMLIRKYGVDIARAHILAGLLAGRLGEAVRRKSDERFFERRKCVIDGLIDRTFFDEEGEKPSREDIASDLDIMLTWFRDVLISKACPDGRAVLINVDRKEAIAHAAGRLDFEYLDRVIRKILDTASCLDANVNAKLAMSVLGMEINNVQVA